MRLTDGAGSGGYRDGLGRCSNLGIRGVFLIAGSHFAHPGGDNNYGVPHSSLVELAQYVSPILRVVGSESVDASDTLLVPGPRDIDLVYDGINAKGAELGSFGPNE